MRAPLPLSKSGARAQGLTARRLGMLALLARLASSSAAQAEAPAQAGAQVPAGGDALRRAQRMLLEKAKQRYEAGRREPAAEEARAQLEGALGALDLAYRLAPAPWLLFNMAQVESQLGACGEAADLYRRYLASDPAPEARASAEQALGLLGSCDGSSERAEGDGLLPGLRSPSSIDSLTGAASPAPLPSRRELAAEAVASGDSGSALTALPWAFGGLAVMSGVAGVVYWNEAHSAKRDLDRIRVAGPEVAQTQERGESAQNLSRVFGGFAVGFALAAGASCLWLRPERGEAPAVSSPTLSVLPLEGGAGAVYRSAF
jgi:hypothetical protein